jgi:hypothetical protein
MDANTIEHARLLVGLVDPDAALAEQYQSFLKSPPRKATNTDFCAWCLARIKDLCGAASFEDAFQNRDFRTLLAFGYMGYAQHLNVSLPQVTRSMPVPRVASELEADFFPVLLKEIRAYAASSPAFAQNLETSEQSVSNLVARSSATPPEAAPGAAATAAAAADGGGIINVITFVGFLIWATLSLEKKKSK